MNNELCFNLFDFDWLKYKKISVSKNEIYNQLILYIFFKSKKNLILVYPTLDEATNVYNELKNYFEDVYLFPEDDYMTKKAIATSPELLFMRVNLLNKFNDDHQKIVIMHLNSFIKKLPNKSNFINNKLVLKAQETINRDELIKKLISNGYKKESVVYNVSDFAVRGFVIDVFPINEENPVRIELFDDTIEKIKYFDIVTQKSISELDTITIGTIKDEFGKNDSNIKDYINNELIIYTNYNQIQEQEKMLLPQVKYLEIENEIFKLNSLKSDNDIYLDTINNKNCELEIKATSVEKYNYNKEKLVNDIVNNNGILYIVNDNLIKELKKINKSIKIKKYTLNHGFVYNNNYFYSEYDLYDSYSKKEMIRYPSYGTAITSVDNINIGDYVVHRKSGIGIYKGITTIEKNGLKKDYLLIQYKGNDKLYMPVEDISKLYKYTSKEGVKPTIHKLNSIEWTKTKLKIKNRIKNITDELLKIYKERNVATVEPFKKDDEEQEIFESEFEYEETTDQLKAINDIKHDLEQTHPMERLLCGDVGYGKTEVIFRAIFKTVMNGKQVAYLCPTTLLSHQQYDSAKKRFANY